MLKVVRTGAVFLLLGIIINISVAWGLTAWNWTPRLEQVDFQWNLSGTTRLRMWTILQGEEIGCVRAKATWQEKPQTRGTWGGLAQSGNPVSVMAHLSGVLQPAEADRTGTPTSHCRVMDSAGWPMLSLWCCVKARQARMFGPLRMSPTGCIDRSLAGGVELPPGIARGPRDEPWRALPLYPLWPGFAINSLVFGCALGLVFAFGSALRRKRRRRRGLCEHCGYDLRGRRDAHDRCPECGAIASLRVSKKIVPCVP